MKLLSNIAISGFVVASAAIAFSAAQDRLVFKDRKANPRVIIEGNNGFVEPEKSFELSGNVLVKQTENGLTMTCEKATGDLISINGKTEFDNVKLTGGVKADVVSERSNVHVTGNKADYDIKNSLRHLNLNGSVVLDFGGSSDVKAKPGSKAGVRNSAIHVTSPDADLTFRTVIQEVNKKKNEILEIQAATLTGPVNFNGSVITKVEGKTTTQRFVASANRLTYAIKGESGNPEVRLTGNLEIKTQDDSGDGPEVSGAQTLVLILNDKQEITKIRFSSGGSAPIKTVIPNKGGGEI